MNRTSGSGICGAVAFDSWPGVFGRVASLPFGVFGAVFGASIGVCNVGLRSIEAFMFVVDSRSIRRQDNEGHG